MAVNRIKIKASIGDKKVVIPLGQIFDEVGREQLVETWEDVKIQEAVNPINDYETTRYYHNTISNQGNIFYQFEFWDDNTNQYVNSFNPLGYLDKELAKDKKSFIRSFFKLDFYDKPGREEQKLMFSMIMPGNNCKKQKNVNVSLTEDPIEYYTQRSKGVYPPKYKIYTPEVQLGAFSGKNENYYIHWLKDRELYTGDTFYMACNFFNASTGKSVRMVNRNFLQGGIQPDGLYEPIEWYYYQVILKIDENPVEPIQRYNYTVRGFNVNVMSVNIATGLNVGAQRGVGDNLNNPGQPIKFFQSHLT
jgi:hypothetical protein